MTSAAAPTDRRTALRLRHRRAILDAAKAIIAEQGASGVTLSLLAERADISQRTVFNHFKSIDDVVTTSCTEELSAVMEAFTQEASDGTADGSLTAIFAGLANALRSSDVPAILSYLWKALGPVEPSDPRPLQIMQAAFSRTTAQFGLELARRHQSVDVLEVQLLTSLLIHGTGVMAEHWITTVQGSTDEPARELWDELMERVIDRVGRCYLVDSRP